ncbi:uncharacterized protein LOC130357299 isoform X1 [Hyla sarda]|uniref:uncharacterized protein LOC130357299 isoform X1 n=1 Tax=Hyla sarda TaxID=327740 RepID=UPI0024C3261E|nr:uncharacterized protein LOC130357299 isoform X1 [Hyla sarda]
MFNENRGQGAHTFDLILSPTSHPALYHPVVTISLGSPGLVGAMSVVPFSAGDSVTLSCSDKTNRTRNLSDVSLITWRKVDGSRSLHFVSDGIKNKSDFVDPRVSFLSTLLPPMLRIRDARRDDAGYYTCQIITTSGRFHKSWALHKSDIVPASSIQVLPFSLGDTVTLSCSEETNITGKLSLIVWRKEIGSHNLHYASDGNKTASNFTDPRISFLSVRLPLVLQIRDARPDDAGIYTCNMSMISSGNLHKSWILHISERLTDRYEMIRWILAVGFFTISLLAITFATKYKLK